MASLHDAGPLIAAEPSALPTRIAFEGHNVRLVPLESAHGGWLYKHIAGASNDDLWTFMFDGPFHDFSAFHESMQIKAASQDPMFWSVMLPVPVGEDANQVVGYVSLMRFASEHACLETGNIMFAPVLQRTRAATEVFFLMFAYVFEVLGVRRLEWKCNSLNEPSKRAAKRLGFRYEGCFRQHMIIKGRNRDTSWFSMLDHEWPSVKAGMENWLRDENFDEDGRQKTPLKVTQESKPSE